MQKFVVTWSSAGNAPDLQINLQGFARLPAPAKFMHIIPLHLNIPFTMHNQSSGLMLVCVEGYTPHFCFANDISYAYTWCIPFNTAGALAGEVSWYPQNNTDEKFDLKCHFMERLKIQIKYITTVPGAPFPNTTPDCFCSLEFGIHSQNVF